MNMKLRTLLIDERIKLVEELWDSIASDQKVLPLPTIKRRNSTDDSTPTKSIKTVVDARPNLSRKFGASCDP